MLGLGGFGVLGTIWLVVEAEFAADHVLVGLLYMAFCLLGLFIGWTMVRGGPDLLRGLSYSEDRLVEQFGTFVGLSSIGIVNALLSPDLAPRDQRWPAMAGFVAVFGISLTAILLIQAPATQRYLGQRP
ncbi:hypothetical protein [Streptomyces sp. NPDC055036]